MPTDSDAGLKAGETIYVTKYCLGGSIKISKIVSRRPSTNNIRATHFPDTSLKLGRDFALTKESALALAEAERVKKIASLRKQIAKLEKIEFRFS
jgi:hypothetical protein